MSQKQLLEQDSLMKRNLYGSEFKVLEGSGKKATILQVDVNGAGRFNPPKSLVDKMDKKVKLYRFVMAPDPKTLVEVIAPHMIDDKYPALVVLPGRCEIGDCGELADKVRMGKFACKKHLALWGFS